MGKLMKAVIGAVLALAVLVGPALAYDKKVPEPNPISIEFADHYSYPIVTAMGTAYGLTVTRSGKYFEYREGWWAQQGSGVVVAPGYVLTNYHIVNPDVIELAESSIGSRLTDVIARTSRTVTLIDYKDTHILATVLYEDQESDIAVLRFDEKKFWWMKSIAYDVIYQPEFIVTGDAVCAVLHQRDENGRLAWGLRIRTGTVMLPEPTAQNNRAHAFLSPFDITLNMAIEPGDSGSPLFAFRDGKPYLIGLMRAYSQDIYWYASYAAQLPVVWKFAWMGR